MIGLEGATMLTANQCREAEFGYSLTEAKRGFKTHAMVYALVMTGLIVLNSLLTALRRGFFAVARVVSFPEPGGYGTESHGHPLRHVHRHPAVEAEAA
jgi:hypothetical protein